MPIVYNYRHALELVLKASVREAAAPLRADGASDASLDPASLDPATLDEELAGTKPHSLERLANKLVETSPTRPVGVARAVHRFMTARHPRLRYLVGARAGLVVALRRFLPARVFDAVYFGTVIRRVTRAG